MGEHDPPVTVRAVELDHSVPTVGWVVTETPRPGRLDAAAVMPLLAAQGVHPKRVRELKEGQPLELPDGTVLQPEDFVAAPTQRKLALLSDMQGLKGASSGASRASEDALANATLMVHESTNACLSVDLDKKRPFEVERVARQHGHSTPQMAGRLARKLNADHLVLTHFSPRYLGDSSHYATRIMNEIRTLARNEFHGPVTTALDLMRVTLHLDNTIGVQHSHSAADTDDPAADTPAGTRSPRRDTRDHGRHPRHR